MTEKTDRPFIHRLLENPISGPEIETKSFAQIDAEAGEHGFPADQWQIVRRLIHTSADFAMCDLIDFSEDAIVSGVAALKAGASIYSDSNMIRSGVSVARLQQVNGSYSRDSISCHVADEDIAAIARETGLPRSLYAIRKAKEQLDGGIVLIGNAPVALLELNRLAIEENIRPALVIGMPVGFVHVVESKEELETTGLPYILLRGRRGGSPLAVAALNALSIIAADR
jgi:precorrin isomerase